MAPYIGLPNRAPLGNLEGPGSKKMLLWSTTMNRKGVVGFGFHGVI